MASSPRRRPIRHAGAAARLGRTADTSDLWAADAPPGPVGASNRLTDPTFRVMIALTSRRSTAIRRQDCLMAIESHIHPLDQSRLGDEVAQMLRRAIIRGELDSGTHLVESVLSERFQV